MVHLIITLFPWVPPSVPHAIPPRYTTKGLVVVFFFFSNNETCYIFTQFLFRPHFLTHTPIKIYFIIIRWVIDTMGIDNFDFDLVSHLIISNLRPNKNLSEYFWHCFSIFTTNPFPRHLSSPLHYSNQGSTKLLLIPW